MVHSLFVWDHCFKLWSYGVEAYGSYFTKDFSISQYMSWKKVYHKYKRLRQDNHLDRLGYNVEEMLFENLPLSMNYVIM